MAPSRLDRLFDLGRPRLRTPRELRERYGLPALAAVPGLADRHAAAPASGDGTNDGRAYEDLADTLDAFARREIRTLLVTSARAEEGKSTTAANLAAVLARRGRKVVLVDGDLRWSSLRASGAVVSSHGLSGLLWNRLQDPRTALVTTLEPNLRLLPAGALPPNPEALLALPRVAEIIDALRPAGGYEIIDSPPVLEADDACLLAGQVDGVLLVVRAGKTRVRDLDQAIRLLTQAGARPLGIVLNRTKRVTRPGRFTTAASAGIAGILRAARALQLRPAPRAPALRDERPAAYATPPSPDEGDDRDRVRRRLEGLRKLRLVARPSVPAGHDFAGHSRVIGSLTAAMPTEAATPATVPGAPLDKVASSLDDRLHRIRSLRHRDVAP